MNDLNKDFGLGNDSNEYNQDLINISSSNHDTTTNFVANADTETEISDDENNDGKLPDTGENNNNNGTLFATLFAGLGSIMLFNRRKNRKKE
ncbi:LPXTG cell wall anchor domain-containing protein [Mammaliicoccus sciuri]|uniref:LPXTG cell wall anchor domain-containing protein n=1 Tax=Mammaliicoccus sciuri TaxID=1296 RepID=UPI0019501475